MPYEFKVGDKGSSLGGVSKYEVVAKANDKIVVMLSNNVEAVYDVRDQYGRRTGSSLRYDFGALLPPEPSRVTMYINVYRNYAIGYPTKEEAEEEAERLARKVGRTRVNDALVVAIPFTVDIPPHRMPESCA
jgi:hypothetical protein